MVEVLLAEFALKVVVIADPPFTVREVSDPVGVEPPMISRTNTPPATPEVKVVAFVIVRSTMKVCPEGDITMVSPALAEKFAENL